MKILLVGARGTIGSAVYEELSQRHEVITAGRKEADVMVDMRSPDSIKAMFETVGNLDAVISTAGEAFFGPLAELTPENNEIAIEGKMKGQINLVLIGTPYLNEKGSFTLTTGVIMDDPIVGGVSSAMAGGAIRAFVQAAAIELPHHIRINDVSPNVLVESMSTYGPFFPGFEPVPAARVAKAYARSVEGAQTGQTYKIYV
ncbi:short chain dehydrogenase [Fictibacillus macauensis ZFHKF-1]|uniref:Short chain dehydrogenase n=1 Tax=Fictibacillus macauensis ZFHKF-1 TaxID=1196324 RepID=I8UDE6_9BACL|nr:short chain dehydrogenase [Fictibacillus macauensis]EIT84833.1 short chain dehydrogenase [Fictibacillus macauensis ZFHKF-1]